MRLIALHRAGVLMVAAMILLFAGCKGPVFQMKVVNEGDYPLTSVKLVPFFEDEEDQEDAWDEAVNLLPRDASDTTISLDVDQVVLLPHLLRGDLYYVAVTFFVDGYYVEHTRESLLDLTGIEKNSLITMYVRCEYPYNATDLAFEFFFE